MIKCGLSLPGEMLLCCGIFVFLVRPESMRRGFSRLFDDDVRSRCIVALSRIGKTRRAELEFGFVFYIVKRSSSNSDDTRLTA